MKIAKTIVFYSLMAGASAVILITWILVFGIFTLLSPGLKFYDWITQRKDKANDKAADTAHNR